MWSWFMLNLTRSERALTTEPGQLSQATASIPRSAAVLSVAVELPEGRLTNAALAPMLGISEEWIVSRTGIRERRQAAPDERLTDYATRAGAAALERAGGGAGDLGPG